MFHRLAFIFRIRLALFLFVLSAMALHAQSAGTADPFSVWDHADNPAAWSLFPDALAFGFRGEAAIGELVAYSGGTLSGTLDFAYGLPGLLYRYRTDGVDGTHELTSAFGYYDSFGLGLRFRWDGSVAGSTTWGYQDVGLMLRPVNYVSVSARMDDVLDQAGDGFSGTTLGLSVRPLAFDTRLDSLLTLSADARYDDSGLSLAGLGARFVLGSWLSVHGRYDFGTSSVGLGLSIALSNMESSVGYSGPAVSGDPAAGTASFGQSMRMGRANRPAGRILGTVALLIDEPGSFASVPPLFDYEPGFGDEVSLWFDLAVRAIDRAATDRSIGYLVMVEPPRFESDARAQEFGRSLGRFRAAGKPVYVYARAMDRLSYVYAAAGAELVALDPNGMLPLVDVAGFSLYLKDLFAKIGIETYNLQSHDTKTAYNMFTEAAMTPPERAMLERYVVGLAGQSYAALDAARGPRIPAGAQAAIGSGPYLDPRTAVQAGLVDELLYRDDFDEVVKERTSGAPMVDLRSYARERGLSWGVPIARKVAVVHLSGNIVEGPGVAGQSIGDSAAELLAALRGDATIAGVLLRVDSGGGSALTSDHIAREVKKLKEAGKPVVVSMASYAASGGYYISAFADRILAEAGTITGSIGVTGLNFNATGLLEKLGIGTGSVSAGSSGEFGNMFLPHREADAAVQRSAIEYIYGRFVDVVAEGRKLDKARVDELGRGQIWLGSEAVENGLIDATGGLEDAKAAMVELLGTKARYQEYLPGEMASSPLLELLGARVTGMPGLSAAPGAAPGATAATLQRAVSFADELAAFGDGLLYLAPEYLYRNR